MPPAGSARLLRASMGPRTIVRGNAESQPRSRHGPLASMGPRTIVRGNAVRARWRRVRRDSFNGAADDRPRKSRRSMRTARRRVCFNGAADDRPRKSTLFLRTANILTLLQWGRGRSSAEMHTRRGNRAAGLVASMGPRTIVRGNVPSSASSRSVCCRRASMGPRTIVRGNNAVNCGLSPIPNRFNGAADDRPRKFKRPESGRPHAVRCFNGAADDRPRKSRRATRRRARHLRFNGAADDRPRKFAAYAAQADRLTHGFNGAADDRPRKFAGNTAHLTSRYSLQWGRGRSSAEISPRAPAPSGCRSFNGAADDRPRKCRSRSVGNPSFTKLQWGRGRSSAEIP